MNRGMDSDISIRYKLNVQDSLTKWYIRDDILRKDFQYIQASKYKNQRRFVLYIRHLFHKGMVDKDVSVPVVRLKEHSFILSITLIRINTYILNQ